MTEERNTLSLEELLLSWGFDPKDGPLDAFMPIGRRVEETGLIEILLEDIGYTSIPLKEPHLVDVLRHPHEDRIVGVRAWPVHDDPNRLPISDIPEGWYVDLLHDRPNAPEVERWYCELAMKKTAQRFVAGIGPTPRAAVLAAIERIGK